MHNLLGDILERLENTGQNFSSQTYFMVSGGLLPLLNLMFVAYVIYYGIQLIAGTSRISFFEIITRILRIVFILLLIDNWSIFDVFFYRWLNGTPEQIGRAILTFTGTGIADPIAGFSSIWKTANQAAATFVNIAGYQSVFPGLIGFLIMVSAGIFIAVALSTLILAKVMMWVLIGTAPIFIACMLFEQSRSIGSAWFRQVIFYALIPLFVFVVSAFVIAAMELEIEKVSLAIDIQKIDLGNVAGFILLCLTGAFVLLHVRLVAQSIATGVDATVKRIALLAGISPQTHLAQVSAKRRGFIYRGGPFLSHYLGGHGAAQISTNSLAAKEAMQNRISSNSLPH